MYNSFRYGMLATAVMSCVWVCNLHAGGSGLNTVVIVNQNSSNSCELGNYYCEARQVPPENMLRINWPGGNTLWTSNDFQTNLATPLLNMLAARQLTNQIDYVVLSMDIPFQTSFGSTVNSTTSALFYGSRQGNGSDGFGVTNSYAASEAVFRQSTPVGAPGYSFLATMITAGSLTQAEQLVNQGVVSDGTFPQAPVILAKSSDSARNIRYPFFDNAIFNINIRGISTILRTNSDSVSWPIECLGYETGLAQFNVPPSTFVPGAIADSMTSFGGIIFGSNTQTNLLAFISAGAAGSYGTVAEPNNDTQKFPNPQVYFYQARGFSLAECYYQSVNAPYLGLTVAEPLAAPFAGAGYAEWSTNLLPDSVLSGTSMLSAQFLARDGGRPLQQVDLFVDGKYFSTLTNLAPDPGNLLTITLNGYPISYTVPTNATLSSIASGLGALINTVTNATLVKALVHGDRIELQAIAGNLVNVPFYAADTTPTNTPNLSYSVNYLPDSYPPQMTPGGLDKDGAFTMVVGIPSPLSYVILASTNLSTWQPIFTNDMPGLLNFTDYDSTNYPARFYRMSWPLPDQPPQLSAPDLIGPGTFQMHVDSTPGLPWAIQSSSNLVDWVSVFTNQPGGAMDFVDAGILNSASRFYRAWLVPPGSPGYTVLNLAANLTLVRVDSAARPYTIGVSTNQGQWTALGTNFALGEIQTAATSVAGSVNPLSTFITASQPALLTGEAFGVQGYSERSNSIPANSWMQFTVAKTNGQIVVVAVTNQTPSDSVTLASQLYNAINANPALQGSDGVMAGDYAVNQYGTFFFTGFNLYARSPGYPAAVIQVTPTVSSIQVPAFTDSGSTLTQNLSDLQPRNHLYVTAGAFSLAPTFPLDTTTLADGYHELTVVAYEGSAVRTQTPVTIPVQIQNTSLSATMTLLDLTNQAPVQGTYHIQVTASTNDVSLITLFSTGGALNTVTNVSTTIFQVNGTNLWAGLHPFYALVQTTDGLAYQTQTQWVRLTP
ncbi:MAG: TIGR03790 family protein [Verrucomicrobiota bacterium]